MEFFNKVKTLDELKAEYRRLCFIHHPDRGGDTQTMQRLNAEYDELFPRMKLEYNRTAATPTHETADSYRNEFYTSNGWKGKNYDISRTTKEVSQAIREYVKKTYPDCKFSVTTSYASMCSSIHVYLMSGPYPALKTKKVHDINQYYIERDTELTDWAKALMIDVNDCIKSYRFSDCDGMTDYFDVNFWYDIGVGKWDKPYQIINKAKKISAGSTASTKKSEPASSVVVHGFLEVLFNEQFDGIEVYFQSKPTAAVREELKAAGFRWHGKKQCWYAKNTEENLKALRAIELKSIA